MMCEIDGLWLMQVEYLPFVFSENCFVLLYTFNVL